MHNDIETILFTNDDIARAVARLGQQLSQEYADKNPLVVGILRGAAPFMIDLVRAMDCMLEMDFMDVSSYGDELTSTGNVRILKDLDTDVAGRHVALFELFAGRQTASTKLCTLLDKPERRTVDVQADYIGIPTPNEFVVGYGLDYRQHYRNLPYIGVLKPAVYQ